MTPTSNTVKTILAAAGIIQSPLGSESRLLLACRNLDASHEAGKWEFPGGKVEPLEHPEATLVREIKEELDLEISVERIFDVASHVFETSNGPVHIILLCYLCRAKSESFKMLDVSDARWVRPSELNQFNYATADIGTVAKLRDFLGVK